MTTIEEVGPRLYAVGAPFDGKDRLRAINCHWDAERRQWWIGKRKRAELEEIVAVLNGAVPEAASLAGSVGLRPETPPFLVADKLREEGNEEGATSVQLAMEKPPRPPDYSKNRVYAKVTYRERIYYVIAETKDLVRCRLTTLDMMPAFWVDCADCTLEKRYAGQERWNGSYGRGHRSEMQYPTVGSLRRFRDRQKKDAGTGNERIRCPECDTWFTLADGCHNCGGS